MHALGLAGYLPPQAHHRNARGGHHERNYMPHAPPPPPPPRPPPALLRGDDGILACVDFFHTRGSKPKLVSDDRCVTSSVCEHDEACMVLGSALDGSPRTQQGHATPASF